MRSVTFLFLALLVSIGARANDGGFGERSVLKTQSAFESSMNECLKTKASRDLYKRTEAEMVQYNEQYLDGSKAVRAKGPWEFLDQRAELDAKKHLSYPTAAQLVETCIDKATFIELNNYETKMIMEDFRSPARKAERVQTLKTIQWHSPRTFADYVKNFKEGWVLADQATKAKIQAIGRDIESAMGGWKPSSDFHTPHAQQ